MLFRSSWGPDAGSIEYGYRVHFGGIHVFIGKIGEPGPEPDLCADLIETAQRAQPHRALPALKRERDVLHGYAPVAVRHADSGRVVDEPIFRLHRAAVLRCVSGEREPFGEGLVADAGAKAWRADIVFFF